MLYIKNFNLIHDNLNDIWLLTDISNNKYHFYHTYNNKFIKNKFSKIEPLNKDNKIKLLTFDIKAAIILIVIIISSLNINIFDINTQKIYNKYSINSEYITNSRGDTYNINLIKGQNLFNEKKYEQAIEYFKISDNKNNILPTFYIGLCYQKLNNTEYAIREYKKVIANKENTLIEISEYNIGLCYLLNNDVDSAIKQFENIINNDNYYKKYAKKIIHKLKHS